MYLVFDTETTGLPLWNDPSDHPGQPYIVDLACSLYDATGLEVERYDVLINNGVEIPAEATAIHGVTRDMCEADGVDPREALSNFMAMVSKSMVIVGHNISFDVRLKRIMAARLMGEKWDPQSSISWIDWRSVGQQAHSIRIVSPRPSWATCSAAKSSHVIVSYCACGDLPSPAATMS